MAILPPGQFLPDMGQPPLQAVLFVQKGLVQIHELAFAEDGRHPIPFAFRGIDDELGLVAHLFRRPWIITPVYISFCTVKQELSVCLKSSDEDGNEGKREDLSRNRKFALAVFPKSAEFVEPAEKALCHPAARPNDKLV